MTEYILNFLPKDIMKGFYPFTLIGAYKYFQGRNSPDLVYLTGFYILFFSLIGHKENRFLLPILPFLFLLTGFSLKDFAVNYPKITKLLFWIMML